MNSVVCVWNDVREEAVDAYFTEGFDGPWPVYLWLDLATGRVWASQSEPKGLPIQIHEGTRMRWEIGCMPTPHEASALVDALLPLLQEEIERPSSQGNAIAERCANLESATSFFKAPIFLEHDEQWFDADGEECWMWNGVRVVLGAWGTIRHNTSDRRLRAIEKAIVESIDPQTVVIGLRRHLEEIRADLKSRA